MKYKKLTLNINYESYSESDSDSLNSYKKDKVYYSLGILIVYVDSHNVDFGKNKLAKELDRKLTSTLSKL